MFDQIIYLTRYGVEERDFSDYERTIISALKEAGKIVSCPVKHFNQTRISSLQNLFVSLGGDGTMLTAMREAAKEIQPATVLGINFGNLGFLTSFDGDKLALDKDKFIALVVDLATVQSQWKLEYRSILTGSFPVDAFAKDFGQREVSAVNEIMITTPTRRNPLEYDVFVDDNYVATQRGDGVIIATATGSTAYAMSAGGAIMCPSTRAMQVVPLAAHTLTSRPIVVGEHSSVRIIPKFTSRVKEVEVLYDGLPTYTASENINFNVQICNDQAVGLWRTPTWNFFDVLREKMNWGS